MKFYQLAKGTVLYHGTDAFQNFRVPRYPCWSSRRTGCRPGCRAGC
jgi:hypothetical protein